MKCDKCDATFKRSQVIDGECPNCHYYDDDFDTDDKADFRAFRRQVLLALISGDGDSYDGEESSVIKDSVLWAKAGRIARAEPKE